MTETFEQYSLLLIYSSMGIYTFAFIAFVLDLARRSALVRDVSSAVAADSSAQIPEKELAAVGAGSKKSAASVTKGRASYVAGNDETAVVKPGRSVMLRVGMAMTVLAFALQLGGVILRGLSAGRVPWSNMYEFSITGVVLIVGVFLLVSIFQDVRFIGSFITGLALVFLGISTVNYYVAVVPLPPALQSPWLVIHVFVAILGTAFFSIGFALSVAQLLQTRREALLEPDKGILRWLATLPDAARLENRAFFVNIVGFAFWTFTLIAGAIWAEAAWGRYWGWDTKEVWTFIIWVIYAGYIHARATQGWRGSRSAWLAIIGFSAVMFNFGIVNVFFKGLHAYSGL